MVQRPRRIKPEMSTKSGLVTAAQQSTIRTAMNAGEHRAQAVDARADHQKDMDLAVDILKHLSITHRSAFESRKKLEVKVFFAVPTFFVVVTAAVWSNYASLGNLIGQVSDLAIWIVSSIIAVATCVNLYCLQVSHEVNKSAAHQAEEHLQRIYNRKSGFTTESQPLGMVTMIPNIWAIKNQKSLKVATLGMIFQWAMVAVIAFGCAYLITVKLDSLHGTGEPTSPAPTVIHAPR